MPEMATFTDKKNSGNASSPQSKYAYRSKSAPSGAIVPSALDILWALGIKERPRLEHPSPAAEGQPVALGELLTDCEQAIQDPVETAWTILAEVVDFAQ